MIIEICEGAYADDRYTPQEVRDVMKVLGPELKKLTSRFKLVGSSRRKKEDIGDIDIIITDGTTDDVRAVVEKNFELVRAGRHGAKLMSLVIKHQDKELQLEVSVVEKQNFGAASIAATGNNELNIALRSTAKKKGMMLNQYGLFDRESGELIAGDTEANVFKALGFKFIPPEKRGASDLNDAFKILRSYALNESLEAIDEIILALGVTALQHKDTIKGDYDKLKDTLNQGLEKLRSKAKSDPSSGLAKTYKAGRKAKIATKKAGRKAKRAVKKAASKAVKALRRNRPANRGANESLSTQLLNEFQSL